MVAAAHARVERHHEAVLARHPRHLEQHVPAEGDRLCGRRLAGERCPVDPARLGRLERVGADVFVAVVGRSRAVGKEVAATLLERPDEAGVLARIDVGGRRDYVLLRFILVLLCVYQFRHPGDVELGGGGRNRTGVHGFAGRCMTTLPPRRRQVRTGKAGRPSLD